MKRIVLVITLVIMSAVYAPHDGRSSSNNLLNDGSFETPDIGTAFKTYYYGQKFGEWEIGGDSIEIIRTYWQAADGMQSVDLNGNNPGVILQKMVTEPGKHYVVRFAMSGNPNSTVVKRMKVYFDTILIADLTFNDINTKENMGWKYYTFTVLANKTISELKFESVTPGGSGPALDDVSLVPLNVAPLIYLLLLD